MQGDYTPKTDRLEERAGPPRVRAGDEEPSAPSKAAERQFRPDAQALKEGRFEPRPLDEALKQVAETQAGEANKERRATPEDAQARVLNVEELARMLGKPPREEAPPATLSIRHQAEAGTSAAAFLLRHADRLSDRNVLFSISESVVESRRVIVLVETRELPAFFSPLFYAERDAILANSIRFQSPAAQTGVDKYDSIQPVYRDDNSRGPEVNYVGERANYAAKRCGCGR